MKIGVLSDTHDNLSNLTFALETFRERGIKTLIHCGDLTGFDLVSQFSDFRLIYLIGNMDHTSGTVIKRVNKLGEDNYAGLTFMGILDGIPVAATHSHIEGKVMELVRSGKYQWVFHGHTHRKRDEVINGVHIVNPGALGGLARGPRSFCIVDLSAGDVEFINVPSF